ncbi:chaperonin 10-like protein [Coniochaeta sp. 2T2.1]|nr:chaperonin 10-like protein [Coniochaeta sp. 2T2.1]
MKALVYKSTAKVELQERCIPHLLAPTDAVVRLSKTTICGTDLHICKGDVSTCQPGRILGHEGVGVIEEAGSSVTCFRKGDRVLISCISSCSSCSYCRRGMYSHCETGGWILGNTVDGTQAEFVRIPHANSSLYAVPSGVDEESLVMLSDIFPTGLECGVLNGKVQPGSTMAIVGSGPVGLAVLITAQLYSPSKIFMIDTDSNRLKVATEFGASATVDPDTVDLTMTILELTEGKGCDVVIEAVGLPTTFELCQKILAPGGVLANVGVHGTKADLFLNDLWAKNITITTRLVDTVSTPLLLKLVQSKRLDPGQLITHRFKFREIEKAYDTFKAAADYGALKILIEM